MALAGPRGTDFSSEPQMQERKALGSLCGRDVRLAMQLEQSGGELLT